MLNSIKQGIKSSVIKAKNKTFNKLGVIKRAISRYRWRIFFTFLFLGVVSMIVAMVMEAYEGNDVSQQGVIINYTQQRIKQETYSNAIQLIGLNSQIYNVPKRKFILYYGGNSQIQSPYVYDSINGRVQEGTKITIEARVSCQIVTSNLYLFLEEYGIDWKIYALEKAKNVIVQIIGAIKFYDLSNQKIFQDVNSVFNSYISSSYPFRMSLIEVKIQYPEGSFPENNTIGIQFLQKSSQQTQLKSNYAAFSSKTNNNTQLTDIATQIGKLEGQIARNKLELGSIRSNWIAGLQKMQNLFPSTDGSDVRKFLWVYFQKMYNQTYVEGQKI